MKRGLVILICLLTAISLTGCNVTGEISKNRYRRDIDQFELIRTIAVDEKDNKVTVTVSSKSGEEEGEPLVIHAEADTVVGALEQLHRYSPKEQIFFAHTRNYVLGEDAAKGGVLEYLDFMERDLNMRLDTPMFIVKKGTAEELVEESTGEASEISELLEAIQKDTSLMSAGYVFSCVEVAKNLSESGSALVASIELEDADNLSSGGNEKMAVPVGYAVLKDGKLIDYIDTDLSSGVSILLNKMKSDVIEIPDGDGNFAAFRLTKGSSRFRPVFEDGTLAYVDVEIKLRANIDEVSSGIDLYDENVLNGYRDEISGRMQSECEQVIALSQQENADFLGIGAVIKKKAPVKFAKMPGSWEDVFSGTEFRYNIQTTIERTHDLKEPLSVGGDRNEK